MGNGTIVGRACVSLILTLDLGAGADLGQALALLVQGQLDAAVAGLVDHRPVARRRALAARGGARRPACPPSGDNAVVCGAGSAGLRVVFRVVGRGLNGGGDGCRSGSEE